MFCSTFRHSFCHRLDRYKTLLNDTYGSGARSIQGFLPLLTLDRRCSGPICARRFDVDHSVANLKIARFLHTYQNDESNGGEKKLFDAASSTCVVRTHLSSDAQLLPPIRNGETAQLHNPKIEDKETRPPPRYNEGTLIEAMQNAWRFVDDEVLRDRLKEAKGIGTPATRAEIIGGLKKQGFLIAQGKHIMPTEAGLSLFGVLKQADPALVDPGVTAQFDASSTMSLSASRRWSVRSTRCAVLPSKSSASSSKAPPPAGLPYLERRSATAPERFRRRLR